jgi:hypothetical protein
MSSLEPLPPERPSEPPGIPKRELWICLLLPAIVTLGSNLVAIASGTDGHVHRLCQQQVTTSR